MVVVDSSAEFDGFGLTRQEIGELPEQIQDQDFQNRLKVFNNYRQFGLMYLSKGNVKVSKLIFAELNSKISTPKTLCRLYIDYIYVRNIEYRENVMRSGIC